MTGKSNRPESEIVSRIRAIKETSVHGFQQLLTVGGFDRARDLRYRNLSGLSFAGEDLRGIDFTGANLVGCDFTDALIEGARFDRARLGIVNADGIQYSRIEQARDWVEFAASWIYQPSTAALEHCGDDHLVVGSIFHDAPFLPNLVVMSELAESDRYSRARVAVSFEVLSQTEVEFHVVSIGANAHLKTSTLKNRRRHRGAMQQPARQVDADAAERYAEWASQCVDRRYRPLLQPAQKEDENELQGYLDLPNSFDFLSEYYGAHRGFGRFKPANQSFIEQFSQATLPNFFDPWPVNDDLEREEGDYVSFRVVRELAPGKW